MTKKRLLQRIQKSMDGLLNRGTCSDNQTKKQIKFGDIQKKYQELPYFSMWQVMWLLLAYCTVSDVHDLWSMKIADKLEEHYSHITSITKSNTLWVLYPQTKPELGQTEGKKRFNKLQSPWFKVKLQASQVITLTI